MTAVVCGRTCDFFSRNGLAISSRTRKVERRKSKETEKKMASIREAASDGSDDSDGDEYFTDDGSLSDKSIEENDEEEQETLQTELTQGGIADRVCMCTHRRSENRPVVIFRHSSLFRSVTPVGVGEFV